MTDLIITALIASILTMFVIIDPAQRIIVSDCDDFGAFVYKDVKYMCHKEGSK